MDSDCLTVAYYDEENLWPQISSFIQLQLPLSEISLTINGITESVKISPKFIKHENAFWGEAFKDAFKKPYLWIYVLNCTSYENFLSRHKRNIQVFVNKFIEQQIEWLILFIHPLSTVIKTNHQLYYKAFEKISQDIYTLFSIKQCIKLYCNKSKTFLCLDQSIDSYKFYLDDLFKAMTRGISIGLYNRIAFFSDQIIKVQETKDFYLYFLMKEGLALTYSLAGFKKNRNYYMMKLYHLQIFIYQ